MSMPSTAEVTARYSEEDQMRDSAHYRYDGSTEWAALLRKLERECPDYRT